MATIKDVAKVAGVTVTTVSRVLNNRGYISDATRKKVKAAMEELQYEPNELARALYTKKSNMLGLIIPDISHPFFSEMSKHLEFYAYQNNYKIVLCNSLNDSDKEKEYLEMLKRNQVDGIIMGSHALDTKEYLQSKLPIVTIDRYISDEIPCITSDNYHGGTLATKKLIESGCINIAHISGPLQLHTPANDRHQAYCDVIKKANLKPIVIEVALGSIENYEEQVLQLLTNYPTIDGIFASSDIIAAAIINVANILNKKIPNDLKVIGYDDIMLASLLTPSLTTIKQPIEQMAKQIIETMIDCIAEKEVESKITLPISLVLRKSI